jgi:hypothetical protein
VSMLWVVAPGRYPSPIQLGAGCCLPHTKIWVGTCDMNTFGVIPFASSAPACSLVFPSFGAPVAQAISPWGRLHRCLVFTVALFASRLPPMSRASWRTLVCSCRSLTQDKG